MQQSIASWAPRTAVTAGALLMIGASAGLGTYYGYQVGAQLGWLVGLTFAGAALGGELLKPFAMRAAVDALGRLNLVRAAVCLAVALVCVGYSLASELALSATGRGDIAADRQAHATGAKAADGQRTRAVAELATLKPARPVAELEPIVATAREVCQEVQDMRSRRTVCSKDPRLLAELGRAKRRVELEAVVAAASPVAGTGQREADPLAAALAYYAAGFGYEVEAAGLTKWLHLVPVLFLEIGSALGLLVAAEFGRPQVPANPASQEPNRAEPEAKNEVEAAEPSEPAPKAPPKRSSRPMNKLEAERYVVTQLALGRELPSQDWLCEHCKVGKATAHEWVKEWKRRGLVKTERTGRCNAIVKGRRFASA